MFDFLKKKTQNKPSRDKPTTLIHRLKARLSKTQRTFSDGLNNLVLGKKVIDSALLNELETLLIKADIGIETTHTIIKQLTEQISRKSLNNPLALQEELQTLLTNLLLPFEKPLTIASKMPYVILVVGVNGSGKTTTIAKLAKLFQQQNKKVLLAAGDTFRAAAIEQLSIWGERHNIPVIAQHSGADSASVIFDALKATQARNADVLIADTAGRLHTQTHLMDELAKIKRVLSKLDNTAPHETLMVLDAGVGQNALTQANLFHKTIGLTGIALTKLDGTAKGGIIFSIANQLKLPIRFIGIGEQADDLVTFSAQAFVEALFSKTYSK